jgi:hypothetical protein
MMKKAPLGKSLVLDKTSAYQAYAYNPTHRIAWPSENPTAGRELRFVRFSHTEKTVAHLPGESKISDQIRAINSGQVLA